MIHLYPEEEEKLFEKVCAFRISKEEDLDAVYADLLSFLDHVIGDRKLDAASEERDAIYSDSRYGEM